MSCLVSPLARCLVLSAAFTSCRSCSLPLLPERCPCSPSEPGVVQKPTHGHAQHIREQRRDARSHASTPSRIPTPTGTHSTAPPVACFRFRAYDLGFRLLALGWRGLPCCMLCSTVRRQGVALLCLCYSVARRNMCCTCCRQDLLRTRWNPAGAVQARVLARGVLPPRLLVHGARLSHDQN